MVALISVRGGQHLPGIDRMINGAASGLMEMATRCIGGVFQNVFGGLLYSPLKHPL